MSEKPLDELQSQLVQTTTATETGEAGAPARRGPGTEQAQGADLPLTATGTRARQAEANRDSRKSLVQVPCSDQMQKKQNQQQNKTSQQASVPGNSKALLKRPGAGGGTTGRTAAGRPHTHTRRRAGG